MSRYGTIGDGLMLVFVGEILCIFSFLPLLGVVLAIAGLIVQLVGLHKAGGAEEGYRAAFTMSVVSMVVSLVGAVVPFIGIISSILEMAVMYLVCNTTADLLDHCDGELARRGRTVWKIYLICTVIIVVCGVLALIPLVNILAGVVSLVTGIVSIVGGVLYLIFLYRASDCLRCAG